MDLVELGAEMISEKLDVDPTTVKAALSGVMGDGKGGLDLSGIAAGMADGGDLQQALGSWLGDGDNEPVSSSSIENLLGEAQLGQLAGAMGADGKDLAGSLAEVLPQIMDKASEGGKLKDEYAAGQGGDLGSLLGTARSFLG